MYNLLKIISALTLFVLMISAQEIAFSIAEKDLIPEGICYNKKSGEFYLSSIFKNKIVKVKDGTVSDFIKSEKYGFAGGVGLHIDKERNILWACSGNIMGNKFRTGVFAFDAENGKLIKKIFYPSDTIPRFFNDLAIAENGDIYITDTFRHCIFKWDLNMPEPKKINLDEKFDYANGIELSPCNNYLFVATQKNLKVINLLTNKIVTLHSPDSLYHSGGLDGIAFYKNSIVAVQNGIRDRSKIKILRYYLNKDYSRIEKVELIDKVNNFIKIPTTLTIVKNKVYVIADSQLDKLDQKNLIISEPEKLKENIILSYELK